MNAVKVCHKLLKTYRCNGKIPEKKAQNKGKFYENVREEICILLNFRK
jgi:hypothetical protein